MLAPTAWGRVTSGTVTPHLKKAIGMAYVPVELAARDTELSIDVRGRRLRARGRADAVLQAFAPRVCAVERRRLLSGPAGRQAEPRVTIDGRGEMYPQELKYTKDHEWIRIEDRRGRVGVTHYAQEQLGDVVYVELPEVGSSFRRGEQFGSIESVKAVSDLYCPVDGTVVEVNAALADTPEAVNQDPHATWMIVLELDNPADAGALLDAAAYGELVGGAG